MPGEAWVTADDVAKHLKVKPNTIYKLIERNGLPATSIQRQGRHPSLCYSSGRFSTASNHLRS